MLKSTVREEDDENTETIHEPENFTTAEFSGDEEDTQEEKKWLWGDKRINKTYKIYKLVRLFRLYLHVKITKK